MKAAALYFLVFQLYVVGTVKAQGFVEKDVVGNWTVTEVIATKPNNETQLKVIAGLKKSTFIFNTDHSFVLQTLDKSIYMTMLTRQLLKAAWQFTDATDEIMIGTPQNHYSTLKIQMEHKGAETLFNLEESGVGLIVQKK